MLFDLTQHRWQTEIMLRWTTHPDRQCYPSDEQRRWMLLLDEATCPASISELVRLPTAHDKHHEARRHRLLLGFSRTTSQTRWARTSEEQFFPRCRAAKSFVSNAAPTANCELFSERVRDGMFFFFKVAANELIHELAWCHFVDNDVTDVLRSADMYHAAGSRGTEPAECAIRERRWRQSQHLNTGSDNVDESDDADFLWMRWSR